MLDRQLYEHIATSSPQADAYSDSHAIQSVLEGSGLDAQLTPAQNQGLERLINHHFGTATTSGFETDVMTLRKYLIGNAQFRAKLLELYEKDIESLAILEGKGQRDKIITDNTARINFLTEKIREIRTDVEKEFETRYQTHQNDTNQATQNHLNDTQTENRKVSALSMEQLLKKQKDERDDLTANHKLQKDELTNRISAAKSRCAQTQRDELQRIRNEKQVLETSTPTIPEAIQLNQQRIQEINLRIPALEKEITREEQTTEQGFDAENLQLTAAQKTESDQQKQDHQDQINNHKSQAQIDAQQKLRKDVIDLQLKQAKDKIDADKQARINHLIQNWVEDPINAPGTTLNISTELQRLRNELQSAQSRNADEVKKTSAADIFVNVFANLDNPTTGQPYGRALALNIYFAESIHQTTSGIKFEGQKPIAATLFNNDRRQKEQNGQAPDTDWRNSVVSAFDLLERRPSDPNPGPVTTWVRDALMNGSLKFIQNNLVDRWIEREIDPRLNKEIRVNDKSEKLISTRLTVDDIMHRLNTKSIDFTYDDLLNTITALKKLFKENFEFSNIVLTEREQYITLLQNLEIARVRYTMANTKLEDGLTVATSDPSQLIAEYNKLIDKTVTALEKKEEEPSSWIFEIGARVSKFAEDHPWAVVKALNWIWPKRRKK